MRVKSRKNSSVIFFLGDIFIIFLLTHNQEILPLHSDVSANSVPVSEAGSVMGAAGVSHG